MSVISYVLINYYTIHTIGAVIWIEDYGVCRVKRMTYRLKSDHGSSVVHPCSWREVLRVTWSIKFLTKAPLGVEQTCGSQREEPRCSLEKHNGVVDPVSEGEDRSIYPAITTRTDRWTPGNRVTRRSSHNDNEHGDLVVPTGGNRWYKETNFTGSARESDLAHSTVVFKDNITWERKGNTFIRFRE